MSPTCKKYNLTVPQLEYRVIVEGMTKHSANSKHLEGGVKSGGNYNAYLRSRLQSN